MGVERSYAGLGLFIAIALVVILGTAVLFIQRLRTRDTIAFVTYTAENVTGLDVSSPVRYLGVSVGRVRGIHRPPHSVRSECRPSPEQNRYWRPVAKPSDAAHEQPRYGRSLPCD